MEVRRLLLLLLFLSSLTISLSQPLHSDPMFSQSPTSSPPSSTTHTSGPFRGRHHFRRILLGLVFGSLTGFLASLLFIFSLRHCLFYATRSPILTGPVVFTPDINPADLRAALSLGATADDPNSPHLIGSGPSGKYYRVELHETGLVLAVKTIDPPNCPDCSPSRQYLSLRSKPTSRRRVQRGLETLGMVRHRNVLPLRAYLLSPDSGTSRSSAITSTGGVEQHRGRILLVYDYMAQGSLDDAMKRSKSGDLQTRLGWGTRHRIAVGVAKGLRHLHFECNPMVLHGGLKPSNVVLDEELEPRLTDSGLWSCVFGSDGGGDGVGCCYSSYTAPECFQNVRYTDKSDIFSFGVILGVLLTGRDPSDPLFGGELGSFVRWLRHLQQQHSSSAATPAADDSNNSTTTSAKEALDKSMLGDEAEEEEMLMALRIAVVCLSDAPSDRPSSDELVAMLSQLHSF